MLWQNCHKSLKLINEFKLKPCNAKPCVLANAEQLMGVWWNKCTLTGDPHVSTFDKAIVDLMQYSQVRI